MRGWRVRARVRAVRAAARAEAAEEDVGLGCELGLDTDPLRWLPSAWDADPDSNPGLHLSLDAEVGGSGHAPARQSASERVSQLGPGSQGMHVGTGPADWQRVPAAESACAERASAEAGTVAAEAGGIAGQAPARHTRHQVTLHTQL